MNEATEVEEKVTEKEEVKILLDMLNYRKEGYKKGSLNGTIGTILVIICSLLSLITPILSVAAIAIIGPIAVFKAIKERRKSLKKDKKTKKAMRKYIGRRNNTLFEAISSKSNNISVNGKAKNEEIQNNQEVMDSMQIKLEGIKLDSRIKLSTLLNFILYLVLLLALPGSTLPIILLIAGETSMVGLNVLKSQKGLKNKFGKSRLKALKKKYAKETFDSLSSQLNSNITKISEKQIEHETAAPTKNQHQVSNTYDHERANDAEFSEISISAEEPHPHVR
ncbi:MAG: hypothetical protein PHD02_00785 [Bacilli bacterium]|nr:hypothetical protein [Bacilli bacterium]